MNRLTARFDVAFPTFHLSVDLDVPAVGITAVFGQSGSGKTSLLRCLAGIERSRTGFMRLGEEVWQDESQGIFIPIYQRPIGYVFQEPRLFPHLSVRSNLTYGLKRTRQQDRRLALEQVVEILGIEYLLERRPHKLSGGELQRVAIGRALLTSPRLLLLDEPLSSLDTLRKKEILPFIQRLWRELAIPIIYVTHSISEIVQLAHVVALLRDGRLMTTGPINEVFSRLDVHRELGAQFSGAVIDARVDGHEPEFGLTKLEFKGQTLYVPYKPITVGESLRVHILSRDVSLVLNPGGVSTTALNLLKATVVEVNEVDQSCVDVHLDLGWPLLATITKKSLAALDIKAGQRLYAQLKSVALAEDLIE